MRRIPSSALATRRRLWLLGSLAGCFILWPALYLRWANAPPPPLPPAPAEPRENGYPALVNAALGLTGTMREVPLESIDRVEIAVLRRELRRTAADAPLFEAMRQALELECVRPAVVDPIREGNPELARFRRAATRWLAEARVAGADGDADAAVAHLLDVLALASRIGNGSDGIGNGVSSTLTREAVRGAQSVIPRLSPMQAQRALARLRKLEAQYPTSLQILAVEERQALLSARITFRDQIGLGWIEQAPRWFRRAYFLVYPKPRTYRLITEHQARLREGAIGPWGPEADPRSGDLLADICNGFYSEGQVRARDAYLALLLAALTHQAGLPLAGERLPRDPFSDGPIRVRRAPDGLRLYSVGPDGVDDGGEPQRTPFPYAISPGDIVLRLRLRARPK
ncbi:MAG: hypothetical protein ACK47B_19895 [Armatimonadota bacterium]